MSEQHSASWEIDGGIHNAEKFFRALLRFFPDATLFVAEGGRVAKEVASFYAQHALPEAARAPGLPHLALVPRYFCLCSPEFFRELARLAVKTPREQLLHHLYLYRGDAQLLSWHDAFANVLVLSGDVPEETVAALARKFGTRYVRGHSQ